MLHISEECTTGYTSNPQRYSIEHHFLISHSTPGRLYILTRGVARDGLLDTKRTLPCFITSLSLHKNAIIAP